MLLRNPRSETNTEDLVKQFFHDFDPEVDMVGFIILINKVIIYHPRFWKQ